MISVADGIWEAARRLERLLRNDPSSGVIRYTDAPRHMRLVVASLSLFKFSLFSPSSLKLVHDGLEQKFICLNKIEGLVCTGRSRKSCESQRERAFQSGAEPPWVGERARLV